MNAVTTPDPITPPPELVEQWRTQPEFAEPGLTSLVSMTESRLRDIATKAANWGWEQRGAVNEAELQKARDEELEACCEWLLDSRLLSGDGLAIQQLRDSRRPKPPSLKSQAFASLKNSPVDPVDEVRQLSADAELIIRKALALLNEDD